MLTDWNKTHHTKLLRSKKYPNAQETQTCLILENWFFIGFLHHLAAAKDNCSFINIYEVSTLILSPKSTSREWRDLGNSSVPMNEVVPKILIISCQTCLRIIKNEQMPVQGLGGREDMIRFEQRSNTWFFDFSPVGVSVGKVALSFFPCKSTEGCLSYPARWVFRMWRSYNSLLAGENCPFEL